jgi:hypothetical protein
LNEKSAQHSQLSGQYAQSMKENDAQARLIKQLKGRVGDLEECQEDMQDKNRDVSTQF